MFRRRSKQPGLIRLALRARYFFDGPQRLTIAFDQKSFANLHPVSGGDHFRANAAADVFDTPIELIFTHLQFAPFADESPKGRDHLVIQMILSAAKLIAIFRLLHCKFGESRDLSRDQQPRELEAGVAQMNVRVRDFDRDIRLDSPVAMPAVLGSIQRAVFPISY